MKWLHEKTLFEEISDGCIEITVPFLNHHNDCLQLFVKKEDGQFLLTDGGFTIGDLADSGCSIDTDKRKSLLNNMLAGLGIQLNEDQIFAYATSENYSVIYNNFIQALISADDLYYTASHNVENIFYEDVAAWLNEEKIRHTSKIKLTGKTGFNHEFHFVIPKSDQAPERIIQAVSNPQKEKIGNLIWMWEDSKELRAEDTALYAILDDTERNAQKSVQALENYGIYPLLWSKRDDVIDKLTV
ncbi:hypothetical protein MmiHf6_10510 [Methanimicrococcus hongohii]|uniref:DUF1828 domain-containing protein n=1 Tax=Methanimicrococcus hongohii TaxID=3028295 RepID=A0AA96ZU00_9EURY|nr:DUF1829 domain-containing protein [Methanimicrococcus sp. Hf6]WNY23736.1 hypothetical protein MmiHf6_10510 [Methanimicrococcus sp. Hf6]